MGKSSKTSKAALSKELTKLASNSSSKPAKSKAGTTTGKSSAGSSGGNDIPTMRNAEMVLAVVASIMTTWRLSVEVLWRHEVPPGGENQHRACRMGLQFSLPSEDVMARSASTA